MYKRVHAYSGVMTTTSTQLVGVCPVHGTSTVDPRTEECVLCGPVSHRSPTQWNMDGPPVPPVPVQP